MYTMFQTRPVEPQLKKVWNTTDGNCYDEEAEATHRQLVLDFQEWYEGFADVLYTDGSLKVYAEDLLSWILDNKTVVAKLLEATSSPST
jgi:hypothetical protein